MAESGERHVLVFPYLAQGHMIPFLDFIHRLAVAGNRRLSITVVVTPKNFTFLRPLIDAHPTVVTALVLPFPTHPSIPTGVENTYEIPASAFPRFFEAVSHLRDPLRLWFLGHPSPPTAIISDMFLGWTHHLAAEIGVPRYVFSPSGAFFFSTALYLWDQMPTRKDSNDENEAVSMERIPNSPIFPWKYLSAVYRSYIAGDPVGELIKDSFQMNSRSHGVIINTFTDLEGIYVAHLKKELGHNRIWAIGPVLNDKDGPRPSSSVSPTMISSWLDTCHDRTVAYICFGSQHVLSEKQLEAIATALCSSKVKFILAAKGGGGRSDGRDLLQDLENRTAGNGVVIRGWAPQVSILKHKAVGVFMTHCGWNSTIESIIAGVPMLCKPMHADQFVNAALLVDQLDVAARVCDGDIDPVALSESLIDATSEKWADQRARIAALSAAAKSTLEAGGAPSII